MNTSKWAAQIHHDHGPVNAVAFSPDGCFILTGGNHQPTMLWDTSRWQLVANFKDVGARGMIFNFAFDPEELIVVISKFSGYSDTTDVYDLSALAK